MDIFLEIIRVTDAVIRFQLEVGTRHRQAPA